METLSDGRYLFNGQCVVNIVTTKDETDHKKRFLLFGVSCKIKTELISMKSDKKGVWEISYYQDEEICKAKIVEVPP